METKMTYEERLELAVSEYVARKIRRHHPSGDFDKSSRWYPREGEMCECCKSIRTPSRAYPYSLMAHCRTMAHVANLFEVKLADLKHGIKIKEGAE
jgi:hypothetical protein